MAELFNFTFQCLVFTYLMFQVPDRDLRFFAKATWCERIGVGDLFVAVFEVVRLQPAFFHQTLKAVVGLAEANAHFFGQFALA